jgi:hypothetical protein
VERLNNATSQRLQNHLSGLILISTNLFSILSQMVQQMVSMRLKGVNFCFFGVKEL